MKFKDGLSYSIIRWATAVIWVFVAAILAGILFVSVRIWGEISSVSLCIFVAAGILWLHLVATAIHEMSEITLTEEGIRIRMLVKSRLVPWREIQQSGVLWRSNRSGHYNDLVLLRKGGSPRKYKDKTFVLRNEFRLRHKLIHLPYMPETLAFVRKHYGPLDFNLADGCAEQGSTVEDVDIFQTGEE